MAIIGMHALMYSKKDEATRLFFRDVLGFPAVDAGNGWLIFAAPPMMLAGLTLTMWLLVKGVDVRKWEAKVATVR